MDATETIKAIKQRGYWRVRFRPSTFSQDLIDSPSKCGDLVRKSSVMFTGWDYPHVPTRTDEKQEIYVAGDKTEAWVSWEMFHETWQMFQSGQFLHYLGLLDDWYSEAHGLPLNAAWKAVKPSTQLDALQVLFRLTDMYALIRNIVGTGTYDSSLDIDVSLHKTKGRQLVLMGHSRVPLFGIYICKTEEVIVPTKRLELDGNPDRFMQLALDSAKYVFEQFQWDDPPMEMFRNDQQKYLERRL